MRFAPIIPWLAVVALSQWVRAIDPEPPVAVPAAPLHAERTTYVGIYTSVASPILREQLGLPRGVGVAVDAVEPDSPAATSGLAVHDVITKLDDQVIVNVEQFTVLVRLHHKGETVKLSVVRHGKPLTLGVPLSDRLMPVTDDLNALRLAAPKNGRLTSIVTQADNAHLLTLTVHGDDDSHVRIADINGTVIYEGPLNTPDDLEKVPADCRGKVQAMQKNFEHIKQLRSNYAAPSPK